MTQSEYFDDEPTEETGLDIDGLRKTIYNEFMSNLKLIADMVRSFPPAWQIDILLSMMEDI